MDIRFDGKRALVTGAGKGIGRGVAIKLAECGAEVVAISRTQSDLEELSKINDKIKTVCVDVGDWEATKAAIQNIGSIDLLVNNAGVSGRPSDSENISESEVDKMYNINVKAIINVSQVIANGMKSREKGGSIVNVSSICSFRGIPHPIYCSSKGAVDQLTRSMAVEYGPHKIRVNSVNPTIIRTNMAAALFEKQMDPIREAYTERTPLRRLGEVEDVVYPILFLLSERASLITGVALPVDGGITVGF